MNKIKAMIVHSNSEVIKDIKININNLDKVEIIAIAQNAKEAIDKIIDLKPDIVFTKFKLEDMNGMELLEKVSNKLAHETPEFKYISSELTLKTNNKEYNLDDKKEEFVFVKELGIEGIIKALNKKALLTP